MFQLTLETFTVTINSDRQPSNHLPEKNKRCPRRDSNPAIWIFTLLRWTNDINWLIYIHSLILQPYMSDRFDFLWIIHNPTLSHEHKDGTPVPSWHYVTYRAKMFQNKFGFANPSDHHKSCPRRSYKSLGSVWYTISRIDNMGQSILKITKNKNGGSCGIRTHNQQLKRMLLYRWAKEAKLFERCAFTPKSQFHSVKISSNFSHWIGYHTRDRTFERYRVGHSTLIKACCF